VLQTMPPYVSTGASHKDGHLHIPLPVSNQDVGRGERRVEYFRADYLAWYISTGTWPTGWMEHINGLKMDNRLDNLIHYDTYGDRWWYGAQAPGQERTLVEVEGDLEPTTVRTLVDGKVQLRPVVVLSDRLAPTPLPLEVSPQDENIEYERGAFGEDWS